jgi:peptide/nickel transport system permease protein
MTDASTITVAEASRVARGEAHVLIRLLKQPLAVVCLSYLLLLVVIAIFAPILLPNVASEHAGNLLAVGQGPSLRHLAGTDLLGRDILDRLLVGTRGAMVAVAEAVVVGIGLGATVGLVAGYRGGWFDQIAGWVTDLLFSLPGIIIILVVIAVFPGNVLAAMVTLGVFGSVGVMRVVRATTIGVRQELYISAAVVSGLSTTYIVFKHVLPRIIGVVIVQASLFSAGAMITQAGLAFLGLVAAPPAPSWGSMVTDGTNAIYTHPWLIWPPGITIGLGVLSFALLGDVLSDAMAESWSSSSRGRPKARPRPVISGGPRHSGPSSGNPAGAALSVEHLTVSFANPSGPTRVVDDATFDVRVGETVGLIGESGCGKTITALAILGLLPGTARIESGSILLAGRDLAGMAERELRRVRGKEIALISQEPMISLDPAFAVGAQLAEIVRQHHGVSRGAARSRTLELLRSVRLPEPERVARRYPHQLSGGMAQRVAIARALAGEPKLLIADEPTTALDVTIQDEILNLLRELQQDRGVSILFVTHDWGVVADICERVVVMYAGQVVERAELVSMFRKPLHPYTAALLASNPHNASDADKLATIPGKVPSPGQWPQGCRFHPRCSYVTAECRETPIVLKQPARGRETRCIHHDELVPAAGIVHASDVAERLL